MAINKLSSKTKTIKIKKKNYFSVETGVFGKKNYTACPSPIPLHTRSHLILLTFFE